MIDAATPSTPKARPTQDRREIVYRHRLVTRLTHWVNLLCVSLLLMSGLQILNAHPALYWGQYGADADRPFIEFTAREEGGAQVGETRVGGLTFSTTGLLGASRAPGGGLAARGFPSWITLPSYQDLATGRRWHFFFAWLFVINGLVYLAAGLVSGHFRRDLAPAWAELRPRHILKDVWDHARLRFPTGEAAKRYNILQKAAYIAVIVLLAAMVMTGLTMSPGVDAAAPWLLDLFGGRQSARTIHFLSASLIVSFIAVHLLMVLLAGPVNEVRSMITGRYVLPRARATDQP
ncbi:cytochrome b/b6 domain-containing protein [Phenylobacterium sp.]|uniref:cytochrome b/b6 domain-containing protein n=1 Tax=Phenylobacterium sp. TaxID=1871053 RepID=UPI002F424282